VSDKREKLSILQTLTESKQGDGSLFANPQLPLTSNFYWDDVYAGEAVGIRKVKYITL